MKKTLLIVEDQSSWREGMSAFLSQHYDTRVAASAEQAHAQLAAGDVDVVLLDLYLNGLAKDRSGIEVLEWIRRELVRHVGVIIFSVEKEVAKVVEAMQLGADHFLEKGGSDEELLAVIARVLDNTRTRRAHEIVTQQSREQADLIVGISATIAEVIKQIDKIADQEMPVLIVGESGTGKELIARRIHERSWRLEHKQPFLALNCAAIPETLAESELFGHERGAFSGAATRRFGKFEAVEQGTVLLDEVDSMPPAIQAKLLRALEARIFERLGSNQPLAFRGRVVAASKRDLRQLVAAERFREDLYYRLSSVTLFLPPLRSRPKDIPLLVDYFIKKLNREKGSKIEGVTEEAMKGLLAYPWPGNVRQLRSEMERAFHLAEPGTRQLAPAMFSEEIRASASIKLPEPVASVTTSLTLPQALELLKHRMVNEALAQSRGNVARAAKILGISRRGLQKILKRPHQNQEEGNS